MKIGRGGLLVPFTAMISLMPAGASAQASDVSGIAQIPVNPVAMSIGADLLSADLPPITWTVDAGTYQGSKVEVRPHVAASFSRGGSHFWRLSHSDGTSGRIIGWSSESFPIPLAFRDGGRGTLSSGDSVLFWQIVRRLEADLGTSLFRPVTVAPDEDPSDVVIVSLEPQRNRGSSAATRITWNSFGNVYDARVAFRDRESATDPGVVMHELMHVLGFGHTTGWRSMMRASETPGVTTLTIEDVAYAQVSLRARGIQERLIAGELDMAIDIREGNRSCHGDTVAVKPGVTVEARWAERLDPERTVERVCW